MRPKGAGSKAVSRTIDKQLGVFWSGSRSRRWHGAIFAFGLLVIFPLAYVSFVMLIPAFTEGKHMILTAALCGVTAVLGTAMVIDQARSRRILSRHLKAIRQAHEIAEQRGWKVLARDESLEEGWKRPPFSLVNNLVVSPSAKGPSSVSDGVAGVAHADGDLVIAGTRLRGLTVRFAFIELEVDLPPVDILRKTIADDIVVACGGDELRVESAAFNRLWRVRTVDRARAHGVLTPTVIEYLESVADQGLAVHLEGRRFVVWDDGTDSAPDLHRRLEVVEELARRLPGFIRATKIPSPTEPRRSKRAAKRRALTKGTRHLEP